MDDSDDVGTSNIIPKPRIADDEDYETDFDASHPADESETSKNEGHDGNNKQSITITEQLSKFSKHEPRWLKKVPPEYNTKFLGKELSSPPDNVDTWTPLTYFNLF